MTTLTTKDEIIALANGERTAREIAERLGCHDGYVRATAQRCGLKLAKAARGGAAHIDFRLPLRDWFAGQALAGVLAAHFNRDREMVVEEAYAYADAMLAERERDR